MDEIKGAEDVRHETINDIIERLKVVLADDMHGFRSEAWSGIAGPLDEYARVISLQAMHAERSRASRAEDICGFWRSRYHGELTQSGLNLGLSHEDAARRADALCAAAIKAFLAGRGEAELKAMPQNGAM